MELQHYSRLFRRYWVSVLATLVATLAVAIGFSFLQSPKYTSTASLFVTVESGSTAGELSSGASYAERQVSSFVALADSAFVLKPVVEELGLDSTPSQLSERVSISAPTGTSVINIAVEDSDASRAAEIANSIAQGLQNATDDVVPSGPDGRELVKVTLIEPAVAATDASSPNVPMNMALGAVVGLLLGCGQAILRSALDTRIRSVDDVERVTDAAVLASVHHHDNSGAVHGDGPARGAAFANAEAYRKLRTSISFVGLGGERRSSIVITSSVQGEGKTETSTNLARVLAEAGESVLLVDADMRRPQVGPRLGLDDALGLSDVLTARADLADVLLDPGVEGLHVLTAGTVPPNPSELLGSQAMADLLTEAEHKYDHVILDAPPLLPVTDGVVLGTQAGGAVVIARSGHARRAQLAESLQQLKASDVQVYGIVLNDVPAAEIGGYSQYYY